MKPIDLHVHSCNSDGTLTPSELVDYAMQKGLAAFALTDHDTTVGVAESIEYAKQYDIEVIPGIELSTDYEDRDIHIVGLYIDHTSPLFKEYEEKFVNSRIERNIKMCEKLREYGMDITYEELCAEYPGAMITRSHFAGLLLKKGLVSSRAEAFERYLGDHAPCYVTRKRISTFAAISLIRRTGGIPVLAHPTLYHFGNERLELMLDRLSRAGLVAMETVYCTYSASEEREMKALAAKYKLLSSGGSDYHGDAKPGLELGTGYGKLFVPEELLAKLKEALPRVREENKHPFIWFTDLDGTLLTKEKEVSEKTRQFIREWTESGNYFVLCSGRDINSVRFDVQQKLNLFYDNMFLVGYNGGEIFDCQKQCTIKKITIPLEQVAHIFSMAKKYKLHVQTYTDSAIVCTEDNKELQYYTRVIKTPVTFTDDVTKVLPPEGTCKCLAIDLDERKNSDRFMAAMQEYARDKLIMLYSNAYYMEIFSIHSGKDVAVTTLCDMLGIPMNHCYATGDAENDLTMLSKAGIGIAMINGEDAVKKSASIVTELDNNHDGLALMLSELCY